MIQQITRIDRKPRSSVITLTCTHQRSIGGHRFADGTAPRIGDNYNCTESMCGRRS